MYLAARMKPRVSTGGAWRQLPRRRHWVKSALSGNSSDANRLGQRGEKVEEVASLSTLRSPWRLLGGLEGIEPAMANSKKCFHRVIEVKSPVNLWLSFIKIQNIFAGHLSWPQRFRRMSNSIYSAMSLRNSSTPWYLRNLIRGPEIFINRLLHQPKNLGSADLPKLARAILLDGGRCHITLLWRDTSSNL